MASLDDSFPKDTGFLSSPREIRDHIYMNILESRRAAPANPKEAGERLEPEKRHSWYAISYDMHKCEIACTSLLSTNRQIFLEVVEMIQRQNRTSEGGFEYKLDLMARAQMLWPTWISLPVPIRYFKTLKVDFRDFNNERSLRWSGCGGPGAIVRYLLEILSQFLLRGPQFVCGECNRKVDCATSVVGNVSMSKRLILHILQ